MRGAGRGAVSSHSGRRANSQRSAPFRLAQLLQHRRRPRPAQPLERRRAHPRPLALGPVAFRRRQQRGGGLQQEARHLLVALGRRQIDRAGEAARRRHREARGMEKGKQLEQVEPRQLGIAQPLAHQRRIEQDDRRLRRDPDRLGPPDLARLARRGQPDAGMAGMEGGMGQHAPLLGTNRRATPAEVQRLQAASSPRSIPTLDTAVEGETAVTKADRQRRS